MYNAHSQRWILFVALVAPLIASASVRPYAQCNAGGQLIQGTIGCESSVFYPQSGQGVDTAAVVYASYGSIAGQAFVSAIWGTGAAGGASFGANISDRITVSLLSTSAPVYAYFSRPLIAGGAVIEFPEAGQSLVRGSAVVSSWINVFGGGNEQFYSSVRAERTEQLNPAESINEVTFTGEDTGRIRLFNGQSISIDMFFGAGVSAFGTVTASVGGAGGGGRSADSLTGSAESTSFQNVLFQGTGATFGLWQGITFRYEDGSPVPEGLVSLSSLSGTDWIPAAQPIPEPSTVMMWLLGGFALAARAARLKPVSAQRRSSR